MTVEEGSPSQEENGTPPGEPTAPGTPGNGVVALGHRAVLVGVGTVFLGLDQVYALLGYAVRRGERVEADAQRAAGALRRRTADRAHGALAGATTRTSAAVSSGLASVLNVLPGVSIAYRPPDGASRAAAVEAAGGEVAAVEVVETSVAQVTINDYGPAAL